MDTAGEDQGSAKSSLAGAQTLVRGLDVMMAVAANARSLPQLSEVLGLTRSTTHRLATTLVEQRFLNFTPRVGYSLGPKLLELGHLASRLSDVRRRHPDADFRPLFNEVEARLTAAEPGVRDLIIVGFLEALQNVDGDEAPRWERLMGPETMLAWAALNDVWAGRIPPEAFNRIVG